MNRERIGTTIPRMLKGIPLSEGKGDGRIWHAHGDISRYPHHKRTIPENLIAIETGKMRHAIQLVSFVLENSIRQVTKGLGESYAGMFVALREMLHDPSLLDEILANIEMKRLDAGSAITRTLESFRKRFSDSPSPYLRERANDLLELRGSLLDALASTENLFDSTKICKQHNDKTVNVIAVVETLTPRLVLDLKKAQVSGIVCEHAGPTSHAAILCRAFTIPAVEGIKRVQEQLPEGDFAIIDGASGDIVTSDRHKVLATFHRGNTTPGNAGEKSIDLSRITVMANLNFARNAITALAAGAQGIGLYRTEFEFMVANRLLTQQEQFLRYRNVVIAMMGLPVTIRLIDIAFDKSAELFDSFGGHVDSSCSGAQFLLSWPELLETQARAIAETATFGPVRALYPMVADAEQFVRLKKIFCNAVGDESSSKIQHGSMIEQPSAVDEATGILEQADFVCLGTNDLTKHLLHVDRETAVAHGSEIVKSPKLWDAISRVAAAASTLGKELTVCGEMASDLRLHTQFTDLGIRTFSMDIRKIRQMRKHTVGSAVKGPLVRIDAT